MTEMMNQNQNQEQSRDALVTSKQSKDAGNNQGRDALTTGTRKQSKTGIVVSDKMDKTIVVKVERQFMHPLYKKSVRKHKKFKAHDENNEAKTGDVVRIKEHRPLSKDKKWILAAIIEKSK